MTIQYKVKAGIHTLGSAMKFKFILPTLTEAESPFWRPIKYSLFPPLGLATLAAFLSDDDEAAIVDQHVQELRTDDVPDVVAIKSTLPMRTGLIKLLTSIDPRGCTSLLEDYMSRHCRKRPHCIGHYLPWTGRRRVSQIPGGLTTERTRKAIRIQTSDVGRHTAHPA